MELMLIIMPLNAPLLRNRAPSFSYIELAHSRDRALQDKIGQVKLSSRQLEILFYGEKHGQITNRELQALAHLSHVSSHKELTTLVDRGVLKKVGKGRGTHYLLVDDF